MTRIVPTSLVVAFLALSSCKHALEPTELGYRNKILFASSRSGKEQLYVMNPDGSDIRQITSGPFWHNNGRWSPDAKQIVCNTQEGSSTAGISMMVMNADGTNRRLLGWGAQMAWSPDGQKLLFTYCTDCELGGRDFGLFIIDVDSRNGMRIPVEGGAPAWSPDGRTIAYGYGYIEDSIPRVVTRLMDFPGFNNIRSVGPIGASGPAWSPSGKEIAFAMQPEGRAFYDIFIMDTTGQTLQRVTKHQSAEHFYFPRWSPDGNRIAFVSYLTDGSARSYLYMVNRDGSNLRRVLDDPIVTSCDWSW